MADNITFAEKAIIYFTSINQPKKLPRGIKIINPYNSQKVKGVVKEFFSKFYNDGSERLFVIGINPGRFGGALTGISFTDPVALREKCGIENELGTRKELSSIFIYKVVDRFGGVDKFFSKVFLSALYPLAIIKNGKNFNYYDEKDLFMSLKKEIVKSVSIQIGLGAERKKAIILGKKNAECFLPINKEYGFFKKIIVLEHPRYIMQYKLKSVESYINNYTSVLKQSQ
jgi:hypothetical protein